MDKPTMTNEKDELRGGNSGVTVLVRLLGVLLMLLGLFLAGAVLFEIWNLYKNPEHVERFAEAVERGSNIDTVLAPRRIQSSSAARVFGQETEADQGTAADRVQAEPNASHDLRMSYFFAWFIVFVLLMIVSRFALAAVTTGGRLALFDMDVSRFARALVREVGKAK